MALAELRHQQNAAQAVEQAGHGKDQYAGALDRDAGMARGYLIRSDGVEPAPEASTLLNDIGNGDGRGGDPHRHGNAEKAAERKEAKGLVGAAHRLAAQYGGGDADAGKTDA